MNGIAVDPVLQKLFYTDYAFVGEPSDSYDIVYAAVRSLDYNGTNAVNILTENDTLLNPKAIIVDTNLRYIIYSITVYKNNILKLITLVDINNMYPVF